jgi:hypothetical protein
MNGTTVPFGCNVARSCECYCDIVMLLTQRYGVYIIVKKYTILYAVYFFGACIFVEVTTSNLHVYMQN